ncbi:deacetylase [Treponema endosymbiont of Eucomonympha sp.]|uniref:deacetylase n=1 Tax=Treponema endosymbiont of Eucomonympha sp. TaxID=1580831 RepID=UPI001396C81D|nr:deacetylase [Treponema endosymbiont of Eucomonympha sp.]
MAQDDYFVAFVQEALVKEICEIGLHIHAWNTPPCYELKPGYTDYGLPYLTEYPSSIMREKINTMINLLQSKFNTDIISHRSGRWATNQDYFDMLVDYGLKIDCSVTPHISWQSSNGFSVGSKGCDYTKSHEEPFTVVHSNQQDTLLEIPLTVRILRQFLFKKINPHSLISALKNMFIGKPIWLRPDGHNLKNMLALIEYLQYSDSEYLMFMLHSSELMPGGSPTFKTPESIECLYADLEISFTQIAQNFTGITLKKYYLMHNNV